MAKNNKESDDLIVDVEEVYSKTEDFIEKNKKTLTSAAIALIAIIGLYYGYKKLYLEPKEEEGRIELFKAEQYFEMDSLQKAVYGDGQYLGFIDLIENYSGTKTENLSHYYLGICYLRLGQFEDAIDELEDFSTNDVMLGSVAIGAIGDANMELGRVSDAVSYYKKAANRKSNDFTSPIYLLKAGEALESEGNFSEALEVYQEIKDNYPDTQEGRQIDKYIARASSFVN
jgi:tetratricopeptide (TPR) repeat protein